MYEITRDGKVISHKFNRVKELKLGLRKGYKYFNIYVDGKIIKYNVHQEVAKLYVPNPLGLPQVNHKDGNKTNNNDWNLEWCTPSENTRHAIRMGLTPNRLGINNGQAKLTDQQILEIRSKYKPRICTLKMLAEEYNVSFQLISSIINRKRWSHL